MRDPLGDMEKWKVRGENHSKSNLWWRAGVQGDGAERGVVGGYSGQSGK